MQGSMPGEAPGKLPDCRLCPQAMTDVSLRKNPSQGTKTTGVDFDVHELFFQLNGLKRRVKASAAPT